MAHSESNSIVHKLLSLREDQKDIKYQDLVAVMNYNQSNDKSTDWDILELYRGLYPANTEQKNINSSHPTVSDAANSLSDQIATYQNLFNGIYQVIDANKEASDRVTSHVYDSASKLDRLKYKLFLERMRQLTTELTLSFDSVLNEMEQIDKKHRKSYEYPTVCGLPQEIWLKIFNLLPQDLYGSFIRATCFSFNVIIQELKASSSASQYQSQPVSQIMSQAAANGQLSYVKFLHGMGRKLTQGTMANAATSGNIELVKFIHEQGVAIGRTTVYGAAKSGNFKLYSYTLAHAPNMSIDLNYRTYTSCCLEGGNIDIIKSLLDFALVPLETLGDYSRNICSHSNAKEIMQLIVEYGAPIKYWKSSIDWTWHAANNPNIECLKYLVKQGFKLHPNCAAVATTLELVQYLLKRGFKNPNLIENAAKAGKLDILKFGYEVCQYPLTDKALICALERDYACFEYLVHNNCPMVAKDVWQKVGTHGDEHHVKLLFSKKVAFDPIYFEHALGKPAHTMIIMWVVEQGVILPEIICDLAAQAGHLGLLMYVHSVLHKPFGEKILEKAAKSFKCLKYVIENGADMSLASDALVAAAKNNDVPSVALLLEHNCPIPEYFDLLLAQDVCRDVSKYYYDYMKRANTMS